jgi:hypothetical protein
VEARVGVVAERVVGEKRFQTELRVARNHLINAHINRIKIHPNKLLFPPAEFLLAELHQVPRKKALVKRATFQRNFSDKVVL